MRTIEVTTDVYARIWALRINGEHSENDVLARVLAPDGQVSAPGPVPGRGVTDRRFQVTFPDGFEVFRTYLGQRWRARVEGESWRLDGVAKQFVSLNELSRAVGAKTENAWQNWLFDSPKGPRPVGDLRDPTLVTGRVKSEAKSMGVPISEARWVDDIVVALRALGGKAQLAQIYEAVEGIRTASNRSRPRTLDAVVRRTLEDHSSDSKNYKGGDDLFCMPLGKGSGVWGLR